MKLITEVNMATESTVEVLDEASGKKSYFIEGIFMQGAIKNNNNRIYPVDTLSAEVGRYNKQFVESSRAVGELGHPEGPSINLDRVSHKIVRLSQEANEGKGGAINFMGRAKVMDTPFGKIVKNFIDEGIKLGVSSRGMGSVKSNNGIQEVQKDFKLATVDIVADPSAPDAFVNGIMEGREWIFDENDRNWKQIYEFNHIKNMNSKKLEENKLKLFNNFIDIMINS